MANAALFIGWGNAARGRERQSLQVFGESMGYFAQLQEQGEIEGFEAFFLEPHGGDLNGFILLRGDQDALARVRISEAFVRLTMRAGLIVESFGVVGAVTGDAIAAQTALFQENVDELT
jgi:hypothetical protein